MLSLRLFHFEVAFQACILFRLVLASGLYYKKDLAIKGFTGRVTYQKLLEINKGHSTLISVLEVDNPYSQKSLARSLCTQSLIDFLILYGDWQGLYYELNDLIRTLLKD